MKIKVLRIIYGIRALCKVFNLAGLDGDNHPTNRRQKAAYGGVTNIKGLRPFESVRMFGARIYRDNKTSK